MSHLVRTKVIFRVSRNRLICWVFLFVNFQHFADLKTRFLDNYHFAYLKNTLTISLFRSLLMWSEVWNLHCVIFPWWLERMFNRTKLPNLNFKAILSSVFISWVFHYVHFQHFCDLKTRFLDNDHYAYGDMMHQICNASFSHDDWFKRAY